MSGALLDTSVVVETTAEELELELAISSMTIAELHAGVLAAPSDEEREHRLRILGDVESAFEALPLDTDAARVLGRLMGDSRRRGRHTGERLKIRDAIIAATAEANGLTVYTRDSDFRRFGVPYVLVE